MDQATISTVDDDDALADAVVVTFTRGCVPLRASSQQHAYAQAQLIDQVSAYAAANGLLWCTRPTLRLGDCGFVEPDVVLTMRSDGARLDWAPTVLFLIEDAYASCEQMIERAATYLTHLASLECVVFFKFFAPHRRLLHDHQQLRVPAVALVFRRGLGTETNKAPPRGLCSVRVTESCSFGNEAVDPAVLESLRAHTAHHLLEDPFHSVNHLTVGSTALPDGLDSVNLEASLLRSLAQVQARVEESAFNVPISASLPALRVDLPKIFVAAMLGWGLDVGGAAEDAEPSSIGSHSVVDNGWCVVGLPS